MVIIGKLSILDVSYPEHIFWIRTFGGLLSFHYEVGGKWQSMKKTNNHPEFTFFRYIVSFVWWMIMIWYVIYKITYQMKLKISCIGGTTTNMEKADLNVLQWYFDEIKILKYHDWKNTWQSIGAGSRHPTARCSSGYRISQRGWSYTAVHLPKSVRRERLERSCEILKSIWVEKKRLKEKLVRNSGFGYN